jgi:Poly(hydroxyalcanoate) granule associated protein (phasin)
MMQKQTMNDINASRLADAAFAASRQVWLAGLGAAAVARHWAKNDAGDTLRALVKEGSVVETQAIRVLGSGVETSLATASSIWNRTREQVRATVTALADTAVAALPTLKAPVKVTRKSPVAKPRTPRKAAKSPASKRARPAARRVKHTSRKAR